MEKYITDERTGLKYELVGDYYYLVGNDEADKGEHIGIWAKRHYIFLKNNSPDVISEMMANGTLVQYLSDLDCDAQEMYDLLIGQYAKIEGVTEELKSKDNLEWTRRMNSIRNRAEEVVLSELIYT